MVNTMDDKRIDFLKDSIAHLENRISIVDNKASILFAVVGVLLGSLTYAVKEIFLVDSIYQIKSYGYIVLGGAYLLFTIVALLLIQTIRPAKRFFSLKVLTQKMNVGNYVMWFDGEFPFTPENYLERIQQLDDEAIKKNYYKQHFVSLQLVRNKYIPYTWATIGMKLLIIWSFVGILLLATLKYVVK